MAFYRLARAAEADIIDLLAWTEQNLGGIARLRYEHLLVTAFRDIAGEPERINSIARPELGENVRSYHLRHSRERARTEQGLVVRPRHLVLYRFARADLIGIGRVLHDAMEIEQHLPHEFGDE
jgi:toxin ParE1/3/4